MLETFDFFQALRDFKSTEPRLLGESGVAFHKRAIRAARRLETDFLGGVEARKQERERREREQAQPVQRLKSVHEELRDSKQKRLIRAKEKYT
jgi:hypothetical protein